MMKKILAGIALLMASFSVFSATFDDSVAAYNAGRYSEAVEGFKAIAMQGNASAQYNLGESTRIY